MIPKEHNPFYDTPRWRRTRERALRRDNYQCQNCRRYGRIVSATEVHHKQHLEDAPEKAYDLANLISLCQACHNKMHPEKGTSSLKKRQAAFDF